MSLYDAIRTRLLSNAAITAIVEDRVYEFDSTENENVGMRRQSSPKVQPSIGIDEQGAMASVDGPQKAKIQMVLVWCYGAKSDDGRTAVKQLVDLIETSLDEWQDPTTRTMLLWSSVGGPQPSPVRDAVTNNVGFSATSIRKSAAE